MKQYTIIFAITRDRSFDFGTPHHECYHHLARVTAPDPIAAEQRCRLATLPGFDYQTLVVFEGSLVALDIGDHVLHHSFNTSEKVQ